MIEPQPDSQLGIICGSALLVCGLLASLAACIPRLDGREVLADAPPSITAAPRASAIIERDDSAGTRTESAAPATSVDPSMPRGQLLYNKYCALCHGENGDGGGKFAYLMNPRPRNFRKANFKLTTTLNQIPTEADLLRTISRGMPGSAMPPWDHLPLPDLQALVNYVRQFHTQAVKTDLEGGKEPATIPPEEREKLLAEAIEPGPPIPMPPEPPFDNLRWFRGRKIYLEACAACHGADGQPVASAVKFDEEGYPSPPRSFVNGIFKGGSEGHQLYARLAKGMRGTPMPGVGGAYTPDETWDLIHYVQSLSRFGSQERAQLRQGTFVAPNIRGTLPSGPMDTAWEQARPLYVGLTPLWWTEDRIEGLTVQALHNGEELAVRLAWIDPTVDDRAVRQQEFRDGVAIQFSLSSDPPFYMGDASSSGGVNIWYWKADRQKNIVSGYQDVDAAFPGRAVDEYQEQRVIPVDAQPSSGFEGVEWLPSAITEHDPQFLTAWGAGNLVADPTLRTPVECLVARGPGTLSAKLPPFQLVEGQAVYERGVWYVQMQRHLSLPEGHGDGDERVFKSGDYLPVSFAIWNGSSGDRDGKKNISIWQKLVIE